VDELHHTVFTVSVPIEVPAAPSQTDVVIALVKGITTQEGPGVIEAVAAAAPVASSVQVTRAAAVVPGLGPNGGGGSEHAAGGQAAESGPLRDLPPAPDSAIGLPVVPLAPSQTAPPTAPVPPSESGRKDSRQETEPPSAVPTLAEEESAEEAGEEPIEIEVPAADLSTTPAPAWDGSGLEIKLQLVVAVLAGRVVVRSRPRRGGKGREDQAGSEDCQPTP
jgi:hypothetical protein